MDDSMDTETFRRILDLINFSLRFKTNFQNIYNEICEASKRMEKTENVNQALRDENQKLTSANEIFQQKNLVRENQLRKRFPTPFTTQRNPKFFDFEPFGGIRDEFEPFKFNMKTKFQANGDWYFIEKNKFNYAFSRFKFFVQNQILFKMNPSNILKINTVIFFLQYLDFNFGDHNKKETVQNKINVLKKKEKTFPRIPG